MPSVTWDVPKIISGFGSVADVRKAFEKQGHTPPSQNMIYVWKHRGRIPGSWAAALVHVARAEGVNLEDCILKEEDDVLF